MAATLTTKTIIGRQETRHAALRLPACRTLLKRLQVAIVNGSDHPCWGPVDARCVSKHH